jgi:hypothetical protein
MSDMTPESIFQVASGFMAAKHLFVANEIGLFEKLALGPATLEQLAARTGIARPRVRILADALVALGLIERQGHQYQNGPPASSGAWPDRAPPRAAGLQAALAGAARRVTRPRPGGGGAGRGGRGRRGGAKRPFEFPIRAPRRSDRRAQGRPPGGPGHPGGAPGALRGDAAALA